MTGLSGDDIDRLAPKGFGPGNIPRTILRDRDTFFEQSSGMPAVLPSKGLERS